MGKRSFGWFLLIFLEFAQFSFVCVKFGGTIVRCGKWKSKPKDRDSLAPPPPSPYATDKPTQQARKMLSDTVRMSLQAYECPASDSFSTCVLMCAYYSYQLLRHSATREWCFRELKPDQTEPWRQQSGSYLLQKPSLAQPFVGISGQAYSCRLKRCCDLQSK